MAVSSAVIRDGKYQAVADGSEVAQEGCGVYPVHASLSLVAGPLLTGSPS